MQFEWSAVGTSMGRMFLILLLAWLAVSVSGRVTHRARMFLRDRSPSAEEAKRVDTLGRVLRYAVATVVALVAGLMILSELGVQIAPLLGAAGVVGIAIGFGAQSLVKDFFSGLSILIEDQIRQGDVVEVAGKSGVVEDVTLRFVQLRDFDGNVHYVPTGIIDTVTNMTRGHARAVVDVSIAYREDVDDALAIMRAVGDRMCRDEAWQHKILEPLELIGVERLADSAVVLRCRFKVVPPEQWSVRREYLRRIKRAFDEGGIEIPFPQVTIHSGQSKRVAEELEQQR